MTPRWYAGKQPSAAVLERNARLNAERTCRRLGLSSADGRFFLTVFDHVRQAELAGEDTEHLWRQYRRADGGDLATAAYLEGVASTRQRARDAR